VVVRWINNPSGRRDVSLDGVALPTLGLSLHKCHGVGVVFHFHRCVRNVIVELAQDVVVLHGLDDVVELASIVPLFRVLLGDPPSRCTVALYGAVVGAREPAERCW